jgi:SulP family sulfate permease
VSEPVGHRRDVIQRWVPGLALLGSYDHEWLRPDLLAALSVWALLIPQALAYAQLAGMPPVTGLYVGLLAMVGYGLFGTSRYLSVGPESSVAIMIASSLAGLAVTGSARYQALAATLALMVAAILVVGYVLRLGVITRLLSSPILTGYLAGSAIVMSLSQLTRVFGFDVDRERYPYVVGGLVANIGRTNPWAVGIAVLTMIAVVVIRLISRKLPGGFIALALATIAVQVTGLAEKVAVVGPIKPGFPSFALPDLRLSTMLSLLLPAASVAMLVFSGSVLTAQALAAKDREDVDANREFIGLAVPNGFVAFFGGFPATASESRSFTSASGGGRSQVVGIVTAALVALTLLVLTPLFRNVPHAALGGVVLVTAASLFDVKAMKRLWRVRRTDFVMMAVTFAGVIAFGVLDGILVGIVVSLVEMVRRTIMPRTAVLGVVEGTETWRDVRTQGGETIPGVVVYRFDAPLFFGNADVLRNQVRALVDEAEAPVHDVLIDAEAITDLDTTGVELLVRLREELEGRGVGLSFARVRTPVLEMMRSTGLEERLGPDHIYLQIDGAVRALDRRGAPGPTLG